MSDELRSLEFTGTFLRSLIRNRFDAAELAALLALLEMLDQNERYPSLRVHRLKGSLAGSWSASASKSLRVEFERLPDGRKRLRSCSRHYDK